MDGETRVLQACLTEDDQGQEQEDQGDAHDPEPEIVVSALSQSVTRHGVSVRVEIYGALEGGWILEVVDAQNASHVWDVRFETDQQAWAEALRALDEEPLEFWGAAADRPMN